jgi:hypothetical protein
MNHKLTLSIAALAVAAFSSADYIMGFSGAPLSLDIKLSDGSHFITSTSWSPVSASSYNQGWWSNTAGNSDDNSNTIAGDFAGSQYRNFFSFDIANLNLTGKTITRAVLSGDVAGVQGTDISYYLFDVSTDVYTLNANNGTSTSIFNDLGTGNSYGGYSIDASDSNTTKNFILDFNAISDITATKDAGGNFFSIGGALQPGAVPEPMTMAVLGLGAAAMLRRRRRA